MSKSMRARISTAYRAHKTGAAARGIDFLFSLDEWVEWWATNLGQNWFEKRGRRRGQYVMARHKDKGPYTPSNVSCILCSKNIVGRPMIDPATLRIVEEAFAESPNQSTSTLAADMREKLGYYDQDRLYAAIEKLIRTRKVKRTKYACFGAL